MLSSQVRARRARARRAWMGLAFLVYLCVPSLAWGAPAPTIIGPELAGEAMGKQIEVLEDRAGVATAEQVSSLPLAAKFRRSEENVPSFGLTASTYWVRFQASNPRALPQSWILELAYPPLDDVRLFIPRAAGGFDVRRTGDHLPFAARDIAYRTFLFKLDEPVGTRTYYMRVQTSGSVTLPLKAWSPDSFLEHLTAELPPAWIFYGLMLVMAVYNLFVFLSVRDIAYLYYVFYILSYVGFQLSLGGYSFQYLWPNQVWWNGKALTLCIGLAFAGGMLFQRQFLTSWRWSPRLDRYCLFVVWGSLALTAASLVIDYATSIRLLVVWGIHVIVVGMLGAAMIAFRGSRPAVFYLTAWLVLLVGIFAYLLRTLGVLPGSFLADWGMQIGASLEVTLLSLGLADRINVMRGDLQVLNKQLSVNVTELSTALDQANAATKAKSEFLASVSHELRTPLNAIINIPEGLLEDFQETFAIVCDGCKSVFELESGEESNLQAPCPECGTTGKLRNGENWTYSGSPESTARHLGYIHTASKHLLDVVSSILDFSRLDAGRFDLHVSDVDLAELLSDIIPPFKKLAESKSVELVLAPVGAGSRVRGDRVKITQVVVNLIGNAIKFSDGRGQVCVELEAEENSSVIRVRDEGIGIADSDHERIFESFSQADSGNTRKFGGTGLGLAITKKLVELHGGSIWVVSQLGVGSTFSVRLPHGGPKDLSDQAVPSEATAEPAASLLGTARAGVAACELSAPENP